MISQYPSRAIISSDGSNKGPCAQIIATDITEKHMNIMLTCHMMGSKYNNSSTICRGTQRHTVHSCVDWPLGLSYRASSHNMAR